MCEVRSLIDTIELLYEYASDGETAIFITADHETGGLKRLEEGASLSNKTFTSGDHTAANVPLFIKNYEMELEKFDYTEGQIPENTVVFVMCLDILQSTKK